MCDKKFLLVFAALILFAGCRLHAAPRLYIKLDRPDGLLKSGEKATGTIALRDGGQSLPFDVLCRISFEGKPQGEQRLHSADGAPVAFEWSSDRPGRLNFKFEADKISAEVGVMFDPGQLQETAAPPEDFLEFWDKYRDEVAKMPLNPEILPLEVPARYVGKISLFSFTLDCLGAYPVTGYLAVPIGNDDKIPVMVEFMSHSWKCPDSLRAVQLAAEYGLTVIQPSWHGLEVGLDSASYELKRSTYYEPYKADLHNPHKWRWRDLFLRVIRTMNFAKGRPEWDGKNLIVRGGSLGGAQSLAAAALEPRVSLAFAAVPAFCNFQSFKSDRTLGFPFLGRAADYLKKSDQYQKTVSYFDAVNLSRMIKCEILVYTGLIDNTCPSSTVFAFFNNIPEETVKSISVNPFGDHSGGTMKFGLERLEKLHGK